ncbi:hypothetical protein OE178_05115, partial [Klebsiella pneumoniae]|nr:hypothetical protein [Klebsiella pneumoniae]
YRALSEHKTLSVSWSHYLNLPLIENSSNHGSDLMANKPEEGGKVSERLHVTFKIPIWLIALIVVMIVINIIVLVALNR